MGRLVSNAVNETLTNNPELLRYLLRVILIATVGVHAVYLKFLNLMAPDFFFLWTD